MFVLRTLENGSCKILASLSYLKKESVHSFLWLHTLRYFTVAVVIVVAAIIFTTSAFFTYVISTILSPPIGVIEYI